MKSTRRKLNLRILPNEPGEEGKPLVLIEGDRKSLEWFGNLILEHAHDPQDCGLQFFADQAPFSPKSGIGFYIHLLPCQHEAAKRKAIKKGI